MSAQPMSQPDPYSAALDQLVDYGLEVPALVVDGTIQRVRHTADRAGSKNGWYVASEFTTRANAAGQTRQIVVGSYGWWKAGDQAHKLRHDAAGLSYDEQQALNAARQRLEEQRLAARATVAAEAATRAQRIWPGLPTEGPSPYLATKKVAAMDVRFSRGVVVVPLRTGPSDADLVGLQWIQPDGTKRLLTGTAKKGAYALLGPAPEPGDWLAVGEGYATCASVRMATQWSAVVAFDAGNLLEVARALVRRYPGVRLVLLADDDHATPGNPGVSKATAAAKVARGQVAVPRFASSAADRGTDWNDLHVAEGLEQVRDQLLALRAEWEQSAPSAPPRPAAAGVIDGHFPGVEWVRRLQITDKGQVRATSFNTRLILENDPAWRDVLGWCEFSHTIQKKTAPPLRHASRGEWEDADDAGLRYWLAERYGIEPKGQDLADAVNGAAMDNAFHPVCDYLDALIWDGVPRLYRWLRHYLGAGEESLPEDEVAPEQGRYLELVGTMYLIQAVSRVRRPGLKADAVLILEGPQGRGKSTALRQLFGDDWFSDTPIDIGSKDAYESIRGLWGFEMAELDSLNKADATRAKAFFSSPRDRFRMPYGHRAKNYNRQCVIAGTTNHYSHLKDYSGNRRFWSVGVGEIDLEALARDRDQLWAEADHRYRGGQAWWPEQDDLPLFEEQQDARLDADVWETVIQQWLKEQLLLVPPAARQQYTVTAAGLMESALKVETGMMRRPEQTRVGLIMAGLGWRPCRLGRGAERVRGYRPGTAYLASLGASGALGPRF